MCRPENGPVVWSLAGGDRAILAALVAGCLYAEPPGAGKGREVSSINPELQVLRRRLHPAEECGQVE